MPFRILICFLLFITCLHASRYSLDKDLNMMPIPEELSSVLLKDPNIIASPSFIDDRNKTGWTFYSVETSGEFPDWKQLFAAGFAEGYLANDVIWESWNNNLPYLSKLPEAGEEFITNQTQWILTQIQQNPTDDYWNLVNATFAQIVGLYEGYTKGILKAGHPERNLTFQQFYLLSYSMEIGDVTSKVTNNTIDLHLPHCSFLLKILEDSLVVSHTTWTHYASMVRIYKDYTFNLQNPLIKNKRIAFSGYPGALPSIDDWYLIDDERVVTETTLASANDAVYDWIHYDSVPYLLRIQIANLAYDTQQSWADIYFKYRSGTYNNQYLVVDFKNYKAAKNNLSEASNIIWMIEEFYGLSSAIDVTQELLIPQSYVASYNVPYNQTIQTLSQYPTNYTTAPRAILFKKYAPGIQDIQGVHDVMRLNNHSDTGNYCQAIAARCDLQPDAKNQLFGAIDCKITTDYLIPKLEDLIVNGPTDENLPPFSWKNWPSTDVEGMASIYDYHWVFVGPRNDFSTFLWADEFVYELSRL